MRSAIYQATVSSPLSPTEPLLAVCPYMLVDQNDADVLALFGKSFKGGFDGLVVGLIVDDQKVLLPIAAGRNMLRDH